MLMEGKCDGEFTKPYSLSICIFVFSGSFDALLGLQEETTQRLCGLLLPEKIKKPSDPA